MTAMTPDKVEAALINLRRVAGKVDWDIATEIHEAATVLTSALAERERDAARLDWLNKQGYAYGFQDMHEGNRWEIDGPFNSIHAAIDAAMKDTDHAR